MFRKKLKMCPRIDNSAYNQKSCSPQKLCSGYVFAPNSSIFGTSGEKKTSVMRTEYLCSSVCDFEPLVERARRLG